MNYRKFKKNLKKEFNDTFEDELIVIEPKKKERRKLQFKPIFALLMGIIWGILIVEHIGIQIYNSSLKNQTEKMIEKFDGELVNINEKKNIRSQLNFTKDKKESILSYIFSLEFIGGMSKDDSLNYPVDSPNGEESIPGNSYETNIQEQGIDEADTVKCDGKYIYTVMNNAYICVYNLDGHLVSKELSIASQIYLYNDKIIGISDYKTEIFSFDGNKLKLIDVVKYDNKYHDSRLINNEFFVVTYSYLYEVLNNKSLDNAYYDNCINPNGVITMYKYDLDTKELKKVEVITSFSALLYASENNFFIASSNYANGYYSFISIIDYDLNPVGSVKVEGNILNQFSMDEHNNYLRVVSTDTTKAPLNMNQISIFSLETLERVGYLNEGIGLERHTVRSVRYDGDTCYVVTYMNKDPLYEIDLSDVTNPKIVSIYESPGYSSYLHTFIINNQKYAFGIGYDDNSNLKISVYIDNGETTTQIGRDVVVVREVYEWFNKDNIDFYMVEYPYLFMASSHKMLFVYNDNNYLYIGGCVGVNQYTIFKIDVTQEQRVIDVYKEYKDNDIVVPYSRGLLINGKFYVVCQNKLIIEEWN